MFKHGPAIAITEAYTRGLMHYRQGRFKEAAAVLGGIDAGDDLVGRLCRYYLAMSHKAMGLTAMNCSQWKEAQDHLKHAMSVIGPNADLSNFLASIYAKQGRHEKCAASVAKAIDSGGDSPETRHKLAQAQWQCAQRPQAYMTLNEAIRKFPADAKLHLQLGLFNAAEGKYEQARKSLIVAVELDPENSEIHRYLALASAALGEARPAVRAFQRAFELKPGDLMLVYQLALAAKSAGEGGGQVMVRLPDQAAQPVGSQAKQLAYYVTTEPDFVEAFLTLPASEADADLFGLLRDILGMALREHPNYADLHYRMSVVQSRLGKADEAVIHAKRALEINPRFMKALVHLGKLYAQARQDVQAIEQMETVISLGGDWADVHYVAGEAMGRQNRLDEAKKHLARALELNPNYTPAAKAYASLAA